MAGDGYRVFYRKDERGVITGSVIAQEAPEGYEESAPYERLQQARLVEHKVAESKLTPWDSVTDEADVTAEPSDDMDEGTPRQAREQAGEDLTGAEKEADEQLELPDVDSDEDDSDEVDQGTPLQAKEEAGADLTQSETKPGEESKARRARRS